MKIMIIIWKINMKWILMIIIMMINGSNDENEIMIKW